MTWFFWQNKYKAGTPPPTEWITLGNALINLGIKRKYVEKVELAAFLIRGERKARWSLDSSNSEYCTEQEALNIAKKLSALVLLSRSSARIEKSILPLVKCTNNSYCNLYEGHEGPCTRSGTRKPTRCTLCGHRITLSDFDKDGKRDQNSITMSHRSPLSRTPGGHNAKAVEWAHRSCNSSLSSMSLDEAIEKSKEILEYHGYRVSRRH